MDRVDSWRLGANTPTYLTVATVPLIGPENSCLKFATAEGRECDFNDGVNDGGTKLVREIFNRRFGLYLRRYQDKCVQSIMGATLKRRESGAGVALVMDIRNLDR